MKKEWKLAEQVSDDLEEQLLFTRGIKTEEEKEKFLNPDYERGLFDPFEMLDMDKAVSRILKAIRGDERIVLYGDYDADGVCGTAIMHDFFKKIGFENFEVFIPDRNIDGYGLNEKAINEIVKSGCGLIITIDCGITDVEEVALAAEKGIDTVILDHHLESGPIPKAVAVVDPKRKGDVYPFNFLAGAGVAFKTVQALIRKGEFKIVPGWEKWLLDLVAIATVADMVPLESENRELVFYGLKVLQKTARTGLLVFFKKFGINQSSVNEDDIAFTIGPRINVASRMDHANASFALLTTESKEEAKSISEHLFLLNQERRDSVDSILEEVGRRISSGEIPLAIIEGDESWKAGVLGLAANRILEKYHRPVFLWGKNGEAGMKGSCRAEGEVNLVEVLNLLPEGVLIEAGGHAFAGGFSVFPGKEESLKKELLNIFEKINLPEAGKIIVADKEVKIEEVDRNFWKIVEKFRPFGMDNPKPVFWLKDMEVSNVKMFGNGGIHIQIDFQKRNGVISAIGFFMKNEGNFDIKKGDKIDLLASVEKSDYKGYDELRLRLFDLKKIL
ncbi:MAG: single-stranded-DNA-specific exonuclease RecJ [Candidatus Pacebacteria bacterium]|nr:single-stranded-DNA-specific exonuclease RecJ [Candidatus Paceibacterota bacterium]